MRDRTGLVQKDRLNDFSIRPVVFGSMGFNDASLFDQCLRKFLKDQGFDKDNLKEQICFISGTAKSGADQLIIQWCQKNGYHWAEFTPNWADVDVEGAVVKTKNGWTYNAIAWVWCNQEMAEVCTHGVSFYDGVSSGTQDMMDRVTEGGNPCAVYLVIIDDEDHHAKKPKGGRSRSS